MALSVIFPRRTFFYALGNTIAEIFTEGLPPEENADVLSLGCGDARNILYTIYADRWAGQREFDITCCDIEAAVLARNVLLLTLLAETDKDNDAAIWDIQCRKLIAASESMESWLRSNYSTFIRPRSEHTLLDLRSFWIQYADSASSITSALNSQMREDVVIWVSEVLCRQDARDVQTASLSAGPFSLEMVKSGLAPEHYLHYWKNGVVGGAPASLATTINPTFYYTNLGKGFCLHYGSDPILGFQLAGLFAPIKGRLPQPSIADVGAFVKQQFGHWCGAFRARLTLPVKFMVRPYVGDAVSFSRALAGVRGQAVSTWDARTIALDGWEEIPPRTFKVIETFNVADHVGLFNVLSATIPLLRQSPWSVLHTNLLLPAAGTIDTALVERLGINLTTLSLLIGVAPLSLVSHFLGKAPPSSLLSRKQHRRQVYAWKYPASGDQTAFQSGGLQLTPVAIEPERLCDILFQLYLHMFAFENVTQRMKDVSLKGEDAFNVVLDVRASFVSFLKLVQGRVKTDWPRAMDKLFDTIYDDNLLITGRNFFQDFSTHAHLQDVHPYGVFLPGFRCDPMRPALFTQWRQTPLVIFVIVRIPRSAFQVLEELRPFVGTPILQCEFFAPGMFQNAFTSIQLMPGEIVREGVGESTVASIDMDDSPWRSSHAPVILSVAVASQFIEIAPRATSVRLCVREPRSPLASVLDRKLRVLYTRRPRSCPVLQRRASQEPQELPEFPEPSSAPFPSSASCRLNMLAPDTRCYPQSTPARSDTRCRHAIPLPVALSGADDNAMKQSVTINTTAFGRPRQQCQMRSAAPTPRMCRTRVLRLPYETPCLPLVAEIRPTPRSLLLDNQDSQSPLPASNTSRHTRQDVPRLVFAEGTEVPSHFNARVDFLSSTARNALAPRSANVKVQQHSPCSMKLLVGEGGKLEETIVFPYPVNGQEAKVRVARTSGYVEVIVRIASAQPAATQGGYSMNRMPVIMSGGTTHAWNRSSVNLDRLPMLDEPWSKAEMHGWLHPLISSTFSDRELQLQRSSNQSDTFVNIKDSIGICTFHACGALDGKRWRAFTLYSEGGTGGYTTILVNAVRLDLPSQSVILDTCILPLTHAIMPEVMPVLQILHRDGLQKVTTNDEERTAWKRFLPACVERCRTWTHAPDCAYITGAIPLSVRPVESPICDCGRGKDLPDSPIMQLCKPLSHLLTRAAIGLVYPVPYLEDVGVMLKKMMDEMERNGTVKVKETCCAVCGSGGKAFLCSRCKKTYYCSRKCQTGDWKVHKHLCDAFVASTK
ncbi:uncharacterized protein SCHCODRAFT_02575020 [Schizophyllum commune H4-8]|nr:uncharacterized protein SCHCODRAFT_02575020 [Schizophyllum commune H4-8]KAI5893440.1 hypothetical protein SCHCODRAFT_02575020 [Schizophyllum commune H4-8]